MMLCFVVRTCLTCRLHHVGVISNYATRTRGRKRPEGSCLLAGNDGFEAVTVTRFARQLSSLSLQNILPSRQFRLFLLRRLRLHRHPFRLIRNTLRSATIPLMFDHLNAASSKAFWKRKADRRDFDFGRLRFWTTWRSARRGGIVTKEYFEEGRVQTFGVTQSENLPPVEVGPGLYGIRYIPRPDLNGGFLENWTFLP